MTRTLTELAQDLEAAAADAHALARTVADLEDKLENQELLEAERAQARYEADRTAGAPLRARIEELEADVEAYRAQNRELTAARDRRDISIKRLTDQLERTNQSLVELAELKVLHREAEERADDRHVLAAKLGALLEAWEGTPRPPVQGHERDELEAETSDTLEELEALGPAPGTPVPLCGGEGASDAS